MATGATSQIFCQPNRFFSRNRLDAIENALQKIEDNHITFMAKAWTPSEFFSAETPDVRLWHYVEFAARGRRSILAMNDACTPLHQALDEMQARGQEAEPAGLRLRLTQVLQKRHESLNVYYTMSGTIDKWWYSLNLGQKKSCKHILLAELGQSVDQESMYSAFYDDWKVYFDVCSQ